MSFLARLRDAPAPPVAVELASHRVSAAAIERRGGRPVVVAHASEPLPRGALVPSLTSPNIHDPEGVAGALGRVLERLGRNTRRVGLVLPDPMAKVSIVRFEKVPQRAQDLDQLVRWQVRKAAPFPIEDAQVSSVPAWRGPDGQDFLVVVARRDIVAEYEQVCAAAGAHAGISDLATFNVVNAVLAGDDFGGADGDWLLVNVAPDYASIVIVRGTYPIFFRNRTADSDGSLADLAHQTAMYYEDRISGGGFTRVMLAGAASGQTAPADLEQLRRSLVERLGAQVYPVDPRTAAGIADRITTSAALLDTLTPLVGMLRREHEVTA